VLITRLADGQAWPGRWDLSAERASAIREGVASLCDWGLWSPDLNATNVILPPEGGALFLDWDRAAFVPADTDLWTRYRNRLHRSLRKLGAPEDAYAVMEAERHP
jgi:hypothetical protein